MHNRKVVSALLDGLETSISITLATGLPRRTVQWHLAKLRDARTLQLRVRNTHHGRVATWTPINFHLLETLALAARLNCRN